MAPPFSRLERLCADLLDRATECIRRNELPPNEIAFLENRRQSIMRHLEAVKAKPDSVDHWSALAVSVALITAALGFDTEGTTALKRKYAGLKASKRNVEKGRRYANHMEPRWWEDAAHNKSKVAAWIRVKMTTAGQKAPKTDRAIINYLARGLQDQELR
jgi:hypothetical protein